MGTWQPISTAPKDGTRILGWDGSEAHTLDYQKLSRIGIHDHIEVGDCWGQTSDSGRFSVFYPSLWMPIPDGPKP
jgi:hypothetical protein